MKDLLELNFFKYSWNTKKNLLYISLVYIILFLTIYKEFKDIFNSGIVLIVGISFYVIFVISWLVNRLNFTYLFKKVYVVFAITIDQEDKKTLKDYKEVIDLFKEKLKDQGFSKRIKVITKHFDIKFHKHSAAEAKTKLNIIGHTIVISGMPITSLNDVEYKFNFHYEFACPRNSKLKDIIKEVIHKKVQKAVFGREWCIQNSADSKKKLTGNILSVSSYILALSMLTIKEYDIALEFLKPIIQQCNAEPYKFGPLIAELRELLFAIYDSKYSDKIWDLKSAENIKLAEAMYGYDKYNYRSLIAMALASELIGDRIKAKDFTEKAAMCHPKNVMAHEFNRLYFCLSEKEFDKVEGIIDKLKNATNMNINFMLHFLEEKYKETLNPFLLLDSGVVRIIGGQNDCAFQDIEEFKRLLPDNSDADFLVILFNKLVNDQSKK